MVVSVRVIFPQSGAGMFRAISGWFPAVEGISRRGRDKSEFCFQEGSHDSMSIRGISPRGQACPCSLSGQPTE